jgi:thiamine biosynthesis protein ThiS
MTPEAPREYNESDASAQTGKTVALNGQDRRVAADATVSALLQELELPEDRVAVELNGEILKRPKWSTTELADGARLEIVHFVGGG